jgi:hypothetical protein
VVVDKLTDFQIAVLKFMARHQQAMRHLGDCAGSLPGALDEEGRAGPRSGRAALIGHIDRAFMKMEKMGFCCRLPGKDQFSAASGVIREAGLEYLEKLDEAKKG